MTPEHVRWSGSAPRLKNPTLIAAFEGWNDAGDAASTAVKHLAEEWGCTKIADIDPDPFFDFTSSRPSVHLDKNRVRSLKWPRNDLLATDAGHPANAFVLVGTEPQLRWRSFSHELISLAQILKVKRVITLGALLAEVPHSRDTEVYGSTEDPKLLDELDLVPPTYEGPTGIVGVLSAAFLTAGFSTASFWAAVPSYIAEIPSPKATLALVSRVCAFVGSPVLTVSLEHGAATYVREISRIVASDDEISDYVSRLERAWDEDQRESRQEPRLRDDPRALVAEVERFLREGA